MEKINLIFFNVTEELQIVSELNHYYKTKQDYEIEFIKSSAEVSQYVMCSGNNGVIIFTINGKADLQTAVDFLRANKKLIKRGLVKPACIMQIKNKKVEKILEKYGCQDILEASTRSKTVSFKIDFWAKNIKSIISKAQKDKELKLRAQENKGRGGAETNSDKKEDFKYTQALNLHSDTWLIKSKSDHKKILKRYLIRVLGPSPHIGQWHELERKEGDSMATWKYVIRNIEDQQFVLDEGAWYFTGSKPEFDWKINRWNFSSDAPHLYFYTEDGQIMSRFKYNEGIVEIAENSNFAKAKEEMILETCDVKFSFDKEKADDSSENIGKDDKADEIDGKLDGKVDEDEEARNGMLEGKSKDSEEDRGGSLKGKIGSRDNDSKEAEKKKSKFDEDNLGGNYGGQSKKNVDDFEEDEVEVTKRKKIQLDIEKEGWDPEAIDEGDVGGNYGGKGSTDKIDDDPLSGLIKKKNNDKKKNKEHDGYDEGDVGGNYRGKGSTDEIDDDPLSGLIKKKNNDKKKNKEHDGHDEGDVGGNYGGKGSTDKIDDDPLSGLIKKKNNDKKKNKEHDGYDEGDVGGNYRGKGSTDEIDDDPLSGLIKKKNYDKKKNKEHDGHDEGNYGGNYGGKGSTDKIDDDPLSGLIKKKKNTKNKDNEHDGIDEGDVGGHYGGKGSTDEIDNSPLGTKLKKQKEEEKKNRKSKFNEDDHGGHYDNDGDTDELDRSPLKGKLGKKPEEDEDIDEDLLDSLMSKKKKTVNRETQNRDDKKRNDNAKMNDPTGSLDEEFNDQDARDGITDFEKNNPEVAAQKEKDDFDVDEEARDLIEKLKKKREELQKAGLSEEEIVEELERKKAKIKAEKKKSKEDYDVDELSRDMLEKLKAKIEALKKAGLSDEDLSEDELLHDEVEEIKKKREEVLKKAGLLEDGDDIDELASIRPIDPEKIKKKAKEDLAVDELARDIIKKQEKKKEALKKAGLSDDDQNVEELSQEDKEALTARRKEVLEKAGLLEDEFEDLMSKEIKASSVESKSGKELYGVKVVKKSEVERDDLESDMLDTFNKKVKTIVEIDPEELLDKQFNLKEIFSKDPGVSTESGELKVTLEEKGSNVTYICNFEDFFESEIVVLTKDENIAVDGKEFHVKITLNYNGSNVVIGENAKVIEIEDYIQGQKLVSLEFENIIDEMMFETFNILYQERQESIKDFMNLARGYYDEDEA